MQYEPPTIDPGPAAVLDLSELDVMELGTLTEKMREGQLAIGLISQDEAEDFEATDATWRELLAIRLEVRAAFLRKFFEAPTRRQVQRHSTTFVPRGRHHKP